MDRRELLLSVVTDRSEGQVFIQLLHEMLVNPNSPLLQQYRRQASSALDGHSAAMETTKSPVVESVEDSVSPVKKEDVPTASIKATTASASRGRSTARKSKS